MRLWGTCALRRLEGKPQGFRPASRTRFREYSCNPRKRQEHREICALSLLEGDEHGVSQPHL
eukprot:15982373-Heterocapsa_arctica.AAC.1